MQRSHLSIFLACAILTLVSGIAAAQPAFDPAVNLVGWSSARLGAAAVAAADLDGDGVVDLVAVTPTDPRMAIMRGTGGGHFAPTSYHLMPAGGDKVLIADLDHNGIPDVVVASSSRTGAYVFYGVPGAPFADSGFSTSGRVRSMAVVDMNGDGYLDIVAASADSQAVMVFTNVPQEFTFAESTMPTHASPFQVKVADMNGDGHSDLLIATSQGFEIHYGGLINGESIPDVTVSTGSPLAEVAAADVDKDGIMDVVGLEGAAVVLVTGQAGTPAFVAPGGGYPTFNVGPAATGLVVADLDGDGWVDAAVANQFGVTGGPNPPPGTSIRVLSGSSIITGHGLSKFTFAGTTLFTVGPQPSALVLVDVNGDLLPDLVTANLGQAAPGDPQADVSVLLRQVTAADLQRLVAAIATAQQQNVALAAQVQIEHQQALDFQAQLAAAFTQNSLLSTQNAQLQGQVTTLTGQVDALNSEKKGLNAQITTLQDANTQLGADKAALQTSLDAANAQIGSLTTQVASLIAEKKDLNAQITTLQDANTQLAADKVALNAKIASLLGENAQLVLDKTTLQAALTAANTSLATANANLATATASLATVTASLAAANQAAASQGQQNAALNQQVVTLNQQVATMTTQVASLTAALNEATQDIAGDLAAFELDLQRTFRNPRFQLPGDTIDEQLDAIVAALQDLDKGAKQDLYRDLGGRKVPHRGHRRW